MLAESFDRVRVVAQVEWKAKLRDCARPGLGIHTLRWGASVTPCDGLPPEPNTRFSTCLSPISPWTVTLHYYRSICGSPELDLVHHTIFIVFSRATRHFFQSSLL